MPLPTADAQLQQALLHIGEGRDLSSLFEGLHATRHTGPVTLVLHLKNGVPKAVDVGTFQRIRLTPST
jgi:hypothetical protein